MSCRSGCPTKDHANWGECLRSANLRLGNETVAKDIKTTDKELSAYRDARKQGIQPRSTKLKDVQTATKISDALGKAYKAR
jgi:hypothetical protein